MRKYINDSFPHFLHGGDYNPEQWMASKEIWDEDMRLLGEANCNELTVGIFSWATIEPEEGRYDFTFLDEIIEKIHNAGGKVILATPTGSRPRWMAEKYPEVLRVAENGQRNLYGTRHNHCYTSPVYREKAAAINRRLAERYGKHPAVVAWHISNEYSGRCYCPLCEQKFREYLRKKFDNDINKLNHAYWSTFWSHNYTSFDQIEFPSSRGETVIHGLNVDFRRFVSDMTIDFMSEEIKALREFSGLPATTNLLRPVYDLDHWKLAQVLDVISWDSYPEWHSPRHENEAYERGFYHDHYRTLGNRPFMLMESAPGLVNWMEFNKLKRPGMDRLASIQAVAHGSDTVQYFQWRKGRGSSEKFHGAVVDHVGTSETRVFKAVKATGETLKAIDEICGTMPEVKVALIYDLENRWALDDSQGFCRKNKKYFETVTTYYKAFWKRGITVDIINAHVDLSKYDLVVAPMLYMTDKNTIESFKKYVENGGTLYATYMLGMVDENDLCYLGGFPANELKDVFGIWNEEIDTLYPQDSALVKCSCGKEFVAKDYCEIIHARGAKVIAEYASEFYAGSPALTVNDYGKGKAYYQSFRDSGDFFDNVVGKILDELDIHGPIKAALPELVTAHQRQDGDDFYLFVQNYSDKPVESIALEGEYVNMETGDKVNSTDLDAFDVKIFKKA